MNERLRTMSLRALLPLLMLTVCSALSAGAAEYSESSLTGRHDFELSDEGLSLSLYWGQGCKLDMVGWFEADGEGNVNGERVVRRQSQRFVPTQHAGSHAVVGRQDLIERQAFSGTYEVDADGIARFELTTTPVSSWFWGTAGLQAEMHPQETWHLVLGQGGRKARILGRATATVTGFHVQATLVDFQLKGESERDQAPVATFLPRSPVLSR